MAKKKSVKIEFLTIKDVVRGDCVASRALQKRCHRATKNGDGLVFLHGRGWYVCLKPDKQWILYQVKPDEVPKHIIESKVKENVDALFKLQREIMCEDCCEVIDNIEKEMAGR